MRMLKTDYRLPSPAWLAVYALALLLAIYLFSFVKAPVHYRNDLNRMMSSDSLFGVAYPHDFDAHELKEPVRMTAFAGARSDLSGKDSIHLILNLQDSTAGLTINGVVMYETILSEIKLDKALKRLSNRQFMYMFKQPLAVLHQRSTIIKEPIVHRQAPESPLESALEPYLPDTLIRDPAWVRFVVDHDIRLMLVQDDQSVAKERRAGKRFERRIRRSDRLKATWRFFTFRGVGYTPEIRLSLPAGDLRAIYRALPQQPYLVIYY